MTPDYAVTLGNLIDALRFQKVDQPLTRHARHLLADLDRCTDGDVARAITADNARRQLESARIARVHDAELRASMIETLILGAGARQIHWLPLVNAQLNNSDSWEGHTVTTLDNNPDHKPDVLWDLEGIKTGGWYPYDINISDLRLALPFDDDTYDEIHAYEVLEHTGQQGDAGFFFWQWSDFWRVLRPGGIFYGSCPAIDSPWVWGDPSHNRVISTESLIFLDQQQYKDQVDTGRTPMSDFRHIYKADFKIRMAENSQGSFWFALEAVKPSRIDPITPEEIGSIAT